MGAAPSNANGTPSTGGKGRTFISYHGTSWENAKDICREGRFRESSDGQLGRGVYVGRKGKALGYAENADRHGGTDGVLIKCEVTVDNPKFVGGTVTSGQYPQHDAIRSDFTSLSRAPEWVIRDAKKVKPISVERVKTHKSRAWSRCATPGCGFQCNDNPAYANVKPAYTAYCCEACAKGLGFHGGWCQKKKK